MSTRAVTGDLIPAAIVDRHDQLMREFADGVAGMCISLWRIRGEETYKARGFASYIAFLRSIGMGAGTGRLYANAGPVLIELRKTGHDQLVSHVDMLRPVALLLNPASQSPEQQKRIIERQAQIIRTAAAVALRGQEPLNEKVIARVAEANFGIRPRAKYQADKRAKKAAEAEARMDGEDRRKRMRQDIELALTTIVAYRRTGFELVQEIGPAHEWVGFVDALQILIDAGDA